MIVNHEIFWVSPSFPHLSISVWPCKAAKWSALVDHLLTFFGFWDGSKWSKPMTITYTIFGGRSRVLTHSPLMDSRIDIFDMDWAAGNFRQFSIWVASSGSCWRCVGHIGPHRYQAVNFVDLPRPVSFRVGSFIWTKGPGDLWWIKIW
jgi:hypothetical protein